MISVLSETKYSSLADHILSAVFAFVIFLVFGSDQLFMTLEFAYSTTSLRRSSISSIKTQWADSKSAIFQRRNPHVQSFWKMEDYVNYDNTGKMPLSIKSQRVFSYGFRRWDDHPSVQIVNLEHNSLSYDNVTNTSTLRGTLKLP